MVNKQLDPENHPFLMETSLPSPMTARVYVNLPEGKYHIIIIEFLNMMGFSLPKHPQTIGFPTKDGWFWACCRPSAQRMAESSYPNRLALHWNNHWEMPHLVIIDGD